MKDINAAIYKSLKAKSLNKRKAVFDFDRNMEALAEEITPRQQRQARAEQANNAEEAESREEAYNARIAALQKEQEQKMAVAANANSSQIGELEEQLQKSDKRNYEINDSLRAAIEKIAAGKQAVSEETTQDTEQEDIQTTALDENGNEVSQYVAPELDTADKYTDHGVETAASTEEIPEVKEVKATATITSPATVTDTVVKKSLKQGEGFKVGSNIYQITNLFGPRVGSNAVPGREGKHSNGIDIVGYSPDKKIKNLPVALTDGVIQSITLQGNGKVISPTQGAAGGYIMNVKMPDGKIMKYMHLGKDVFLNKANLLGKTIKRGDILYEGDYSKGSGSQTGPHIKVSVTSVDSSGKELKDYSNPDNDPTVYALYGKYIPQTESAPSDIQS